MESPDSPGGFTPPTRRDSRATVTPAPPNQPQGTKRNPDSTTNRRLTTDLGQKAIDRLAEQFPNTILVHTSVHASWLNQVEIVFSIVQRKVLSPNDFDDLDVVVERLAAFRNP